MSVLGGWQTEWWRLVQVPSRYEKAFFSAEEAQTHHRYNMDWVCFDFLNYLNILWNKYTPSSLSLPPCTLSPFPFCPLWLSPQPSWSWTFLQLQRTHTIAWLLTYCRLNLTQTAGYAPPGRSWSSLPGMSMCQTPHTGTEQAFGFFVFNLFVKFIWRLYSFVTMKLSFQIISCKNTSCF